MIQTGALEIDGEVPTGSSGACEVSDTWPSSSLSVQRGFLAPAR